MSKPKTAADWERLAREHVEYANSERLGNLQAAARQTAERAYAKAAELRAKGGAR